jgi:hypothetical protein
MLLSRIRLECTLVLALFIALQGCAQPVEPTQFVRTKPDDSVLPGMSERAWGPEASRSFFPLQVGNRWTYSFHSWTTSVTCPDELETPPPWEMRGTLEQEITCVRESGGKSLFVVREQASLTTAPWITEPEIGVDWTYYRQDKKGLYLGNFREDGDPCDSPDLRSRESNVGDPVGELFHKGLYSLPLPSELIPFVETKVLGYPLRVGARWSWDRNGSVGQVVEAVEVLDLPLGRVRAYRVSAFGLLPGWRIVWWYGRDGLLKRVGHRPPGCEFPPCGCRSVVDDTLVVTALRLLNSDRDFLFSIPLK